MNNQEFDNKALLAQWALALFINPIFPALRSGHRLFQRPSLQKQFLSNLVQRLSPEKRFSSGFSVRARVVSSAVVILFLSGATSSVVLADIFRIDLPQLEGGYQYGQSSAVVPVNLGTPLLDLTSIQIELSGEHTTGWWRGDMVEDFYVGPKGGSLYARMDSASSYPWYLFGGTGVVGNGPFTATITLHRSGDGSDWSFLRDGITDLTLSQSMVVGWGGFTMPPFFNLTHVALVINATPMPTPPPVSAGELAAPGIAISGGNLKFTVQPSVVGRRYQLQSSDTMAPGTWQLVGTMRFGDGTPLVISTPYAPAVRQRFYRLVLDGPLTP